MRHTPQFAPIAAAPSATGAGVFSVAYGFRPVSRPATMMYRTVQIISDPRMPNGKSFCGFLDSCAAVETASNPIYAKNTTLAPRMIPDQPYSPKCPRFFGMNG